MKMLPTVVCLSASAVFLVASAPADASGKSARERQLRQHPLPQSSYRYRPDYYEHLVDKASDRLGAVVGADAPQRR